jgi:glycosyltransferase involved in cell wall biosynthesis
MYNCPSLAELPPSPVGKEGWPWTEAPALNSEAPWPSISIVTPSFNQGRFIEETIRSVLLQGYSNLEYIIIDGGSTDESVQIIKKYSRWLKYWVTEPDRGQSHAINKGLEHCSGDIFNWINSDDLLVAGALHTVATVWNRTPNLVIAGATVNFDANGSEDLHSPNAITLENFIDWRKAEKNGWMWQQPSTFLPRADVARVGGVREDLRFSMDHFLMIDILQQCNVVYVSNILARFRLHSDSKTVSAGSLRFSLERLTKLRSMTDLHEYVSAKDLKQLQVSVLMTFAEQEWDNKRFYSACQSYTKALAELPFLTIRIFIRRSIFGQVIRRIRGYPPRNS